MKKYLVRAIFSLFLLKISSCFGISSKERETWFHFRSSTFKLQTRQPGSRLDATEDLVCARICLADEECVGFHAVVGNQCRTFNTPVGPVGAIWKRYPDASQAVRKHPSVHDVHKTPNVMFVSATKGSASFKVLNTGIGTTKIFDPPIPAKGDVAVITAVISTGEIFLCFNNPVRIYSVKISQGQSVDLVFSSQFKTIGAFVMRKHKAYVSIGKDISALTLLPPKPKYEHITNSTITDTPLFHDVIQKKSILFWPLSKLNLIARFNADTRTKLQPLKTAARSQANNVLTCMTIDRNMHVIYVLSTDGTLSRLNAIGQASSASQPELVLRLPVHGFPGQRLMYRKKFLFMTSTNISIDVVDLEKSKFLPNAIIWGYSSSAPDVVTIIE